MKSRVLLLLFLLSFTNSFSQTRGVGPITEVRVNVYVSPSKVQRGDKLTVSVSFESNTSETGFVKNITYCKEGQSTYHPMTSLNGNKAELLISESFSNGNYIISVDYGKSESSGTYNKTASFEVGELNGKVSINKTLIPLKENLIVTGEEFLSENVRLSLRQSGYSTTVKPNYGNFTHTIKANELLVKYDTLDVKYDNSDKIIHSIPFQVDYKFDLSLKSNTPDCYTPVGCVTDGTTSLAIMANINIDDFDYFTLSLKHATSNIENTDIIGNFHNKSILYSPSNK